MEIPGYDIIGELAVDRDAHRYLARRTEDGTDVLITVVPAPEGDEGNALNHLASDVKLMMAQPHHGLVRVLDGQWVDDAFAVVTPRPANPTLEQLLVRREEEFPYARIATILRDINAALVWARDRGIVHRAIRLENVFVEPGSDRTVVAFNVRPIGLTNMPGAEDDDRTVAGLASAMFTRGRRAEEGESLADLRPGLPASLIAQTNALTGQRAEGDETPAPEITSYIAAIAMADALKEGELHLEENRNLIETQKAEHQAQLEKERQEHAEALAKEKAAHQKEREAHQRDREAYERDREVLRIEREGYERERELLRRERQDYDKEMSAILAQKAKQRTREGMELVARGWRRRPMWTNRLTRNWKTTAPIVAGAALLLIAAVALTQRENTPRRDVIADSAAGLVTPAPAVAAATPLMTVSDSVAADSVARDSVGVPPGFVASVMARAESLWARRPFQSRAQTEAASRAARPVRQFDTIFTSQKLPPRDTASRQRDSLARADSLPRSVVPPVDTIVRRDSIRRDTTRRDTLPSAPDTLSRR